MEIHDGDNVGSTLVGDTYFCGDRIPDVIDSTGHSLMVRFKTDHGVADTGFEIAIDSGKNKKFVIIPYVALPMLKYINVEESSAISIPAFIFMNSDLNLFHKNILKVI